MTDPFFNDNQFTWIPADQYADEDYRAAGSNEKNFYLAAGYGDNRTLREYLNQPNFDVNKPDPDGDTALFCAASKQQTSAARILLEYGANPNIAGKSGPPLNIASSHGDYGLVNILLDKGADINGDGISTPIFDSTTHGHYRLAAHLLFQGADPNRASGPHNITPIMRAAQLGSYQLVKDLINCGANVNARDKDGNTPIVYTTLAPFPISYNREVIIVLLLHGASYNELKSRGISLVRTWDERDDDGFFFHTCCEEISPYEITEDMLYDPKVCIREDTSKGPIFHMNYVPGGRSRSR